MKKILFYLFVGFAQGLAAQITISSPNDRIKAEIFLGNKTYYSVYFDGKPVLEASPISMTIDGKEKGNEPVMMDTKQENINQTLFPVWGSRSEVSDHYNQLQMDFEGGYSIQFRLYDKGVAYRFITNLEGNVVVNDELVSYKFGEEAIAWLSKQRSYETNYTPFDLDSMNELQDKVYLPAMVQVSEKVKVVITEANLLDYPSLFLKRDEGRENQLIGTFEPFALKTRLGGYNNYSYLASEEADFIAKTEGKRSYPWRVMIITDDDHTLADCDLVYQLSEPSRLTETDWIQPGKVAWEWWHGRVVEGQPFIGGINTKTYLYHIDFAAKYGLEYILIDAGWTGKYDLTQINPDVDIEKIIGYADSKGVKVILWCPGHSLHNQMVEALDLFASLGAAGVKADFFGREDQTGIKIYEELAAATGERKLLIDFHGCAKPTGLSRTYPNVINYEAVAGNEWNRLDQDKITVEHKVIVPFIRGIQGPMDFTPGGMRNIQSGHHLRKVLPEVHGTRANESALFVIYNEPLKMMCDAPSVYNREEQYTRFISKIPTIWDETKVLEAKFGEYLVEARRTDTIWYLAGISGTESKEVLLDFNFLDAGTFQYTLLVDGPNAYRVGTDYLWDSGQLTASEHKKILMTQGGGFVMRIEKEGQ